MRSGRPGPVLIDLPFDVQMAEIEFDPETYEPLPVYKPHATRTQIEKAMAMLNDADRPVSSRAAASSTPTRPTCSCNLPKPPASR
jgi:glyoxylate carboligase